IRKIIAENFDFPSMSREVLGDQWGKLGEAERKEFQTIFQDLFQSSYTRLVLDFLKQEKVVYGKEEVRDDKAQVKTTIARLNEEIPVDYALARAGGKWMVEDVVIDGVSIVRNYQRSFGQVIQRESFKSLLQKMRLQQKAVEKSS
ncbi:MAG TPA: ABC transporter substrate-binding protein, partial [Thermodesulfobacteriota bacterium]|nr:ABC transporter substrate-binding protein [Thermodesulfobacteriota bacterium]